MRIIDYCPVFYSDDLEKEIRRFTEDLGFEVIRRPQIENLDYMVLENANKRCVDLVRSYFPADDFEEGYLGMRATVDNFEEGLAYFEGQGYSLFGTAHETESFIAALLAKDDGSHIVLFHHKR